MCPVSKITSITAGEEASRQLRAKSLLRNKPPITVRKGKKWTRHVHS